MKVSQAIVEGFECVIYATILVLFLHPLRRFIFADLYTEMSNGQEITIFVSLALFCAFFVIKPLLRSFRSSK